MAFSTVYVCKIIAPLISFRECCKIWGHYEKTLILCKIDNPKPFTAGLLITYLLSPLIWYITSTFEFHVSSIPQIQAYLDNHLLQCRYSNITSISYYHNYFLEIGVHDDTHYIVIYLIVKYNKVWANLDVLLISLGVYVNRDFSLCSISSNFHEKWVHYDKYHILSDLNRAVYMYLRESDILLHLALCGCE